MWRLLLLLLPLLTACQSAFFGVVNLRAGAGGIDPQQTASYSPDHGLQLDVYAATASAGKPAPVVVFFYGGSWQNGERGWYRFVAQALVAEGVHVVIPDYRKYPQVHFPEFMHDAAAALAYVRAHAGEWGGDPDRIVLMGHSAGAHVAALLVADERYLGGVGMRADDIAGFIGLSGPYDFLPITSRTLQKLFGDDASQQASQPVNHLHARMPRTLLIHGSADRVVWPRNSEALANGLRGLGVRVETQWIDGAGHSDTLLALRLGRDDHEQLMRPIRAFLAANVSQ